MLSPELIAEDQTMLPDKKLLQGKLNELYNQKCQQRGRGHRQTQGISRRKRPVKGLRSDFEKGSNILPVLALVDQLAGWAICCGVNCDLRPVSRPGAGPFTDEAAPQFGRLGRTAIGEFGAKVSFARRTPAFFIMKPRSHALDETN
jgi:hypothetical protein